MNRFTKIASAIATFSIILGVVCIGVAFAMGLTWEEFVDMAKQGKFSIQFGEYLESSSLNDNLEFDEACENLEIELAAGTLEIYYDNVEHIQIEQNGMKGFKSYIDGKTLHIEGGRKLGINQVDMSVTVILPENMKFEKVDLEVGAGKALIDDLIADKVSVEVGAGEAVITGLTVKELQAEVGAGKLNLELAGKETDYNYNLDCGIGEIQIGDNSYAGLGKEQRTVNTGANKQIDLECGVGEIIINFTE